MRVVIADADQGYLEILQSYLWDHGYEVEFATDGLECLAVVRCFQPEVLVLSLDLLWGGAEGVLSLIREDERFTELCIVLATDTREPFEAAAAGRVAAWLRRPFRLGELLARLRSVAAWKGLPACLQELRHAAL